MSKRGVVGEFIGDAIMAWWNVPVHLGESGKRWEKASQKQGPRLQTPTFFRVSCRPSTKKGGIYLEKPGFSKKQNLEKVGIWSRRGFLPGSLQVAPLVVSEQPT